MPSSERAREIANKKALRNRKLQKIRKEMDAILDDAFKAVIGQDKNGHKTVLVSTKLDKQSARTAVSLREWRFRRIMEAIEKNMSVREAAEYARCSVSHIHWYERNKGIPKFRRLTEEQRSTIGRAVYLERKKK